MTEFAIKGCLEILPEAQYIFYLFKTRIYTDCTELFLAALISVNLCQYKYSQGR
jgi:hypothetical protein